MTPGVCRRGSSSLRIVPSARAASSRVTVTRNFPSTAGSASFVASIAAWSSATTILFASASSRPPATGTAQAERNSRNEPRALA